MIPIKIKLKPQDFIVNELVNLDIEKEGEFGLYILKKEGYGTIEILKLLSKKLNIPFSYFSYGGRKDKHSQSTQYITIKTKEQFNIERSTYSLKFLGYTKKPMQPAFIVKNEFKIVVRNLDRGLEEKVIKSIEDVKNFGYPNYFDDQRFGCFDRRSGFLAEKILKRHYSGALKIYLTSFRGKDTIKDKERKKFFFKNWGNWKICLERAKTEYEKYVFSFLRENPKSFIFLLQRIPKQEMSLFFSAYQSYLWNILIKRIIKETVKENLKSYKGLIEDYIFYEKLNEQNLFLKGLIIPLPAKKTNMPEQFDNLYKKILEEKQIKPSSFDNRKIRQAFFKPIPRFVVATPSNINYEFLDDEIYKGKIKLVLGFGLPRGCYATMFIKRLFS
ncbi:MAG: tRNA pseudouridine(13) synthase TruD [Candidatus Aenigmatarchaeota archaeon]